MRLRSGLRDGFVTGLLLFAPLAVTLFVLQFTFTRLTAVLDPVVATTRLGALTDNRLLAQLLAAALIATLITAGGALAQRSGGQRVVRGFDRLVSLVPLVNVVYTGVRQVSDALTAGEGRYEEAVLVEYPRLGVYSLGFVTGDGPPGAETIAGEKTRFVIVPHSPNPTVGHLIVVPERKLHDTELSVRRALRLLVTTGVAESENELAELAERVGGPVVPGAGTTPGPAGAWDEGDRAQEDGDPDRD
jgi:uncharacterized membrane protein